MRKVVAILLLMLYIISSSGVAIKAHYCCGKLQSLNLVLNSSEEKDCKKGCCSDRLAFYKIDDTQSASTVITFSPSFDKIFYQVSYIVKTCFDPYPTSCVSGLVCEAFAPPPKKDINIAICVFRL
ncbi:MAG: hypothetical protein JWO03_2085 [Bacteroidetes bacterium]|nr:hypothetical protein [Bacteroidota bacterium]